MRRFYAPVDNFISGTVVLDADETRHLSGVLKLRRGEIVQIFDGDGREFRCEIKDVGKISAELQILDEIPPAVPESNLDLTLAAAILKGEKFDLVIQKAVELGVTRLAPMQTIRGDVKIKDDAKKLERWRKIALEAAKQSGRAKLMPISNVIGFEQLLKSNSEDKEVILFSERDGEEFTLAKITKKVTALIGPEGGWDDIELEFARKSGARIFTLGGRILRAETAAIAISAILQHRFGDLN